MQRGWTKSLSTKECSIFFMSCGTHPSILNRSDLMRRLYGDNVFEKCGINRDGAGEVGKPRYFNGKRHF